MATAQVFQFGIEAAGSAPSNAQVFQFGIEVALIGTTPPTPAATPATPSGGSAYVRSNCGKRTFWDECLEAEARALRRIRFPDLCSIPPEYRNLLPWDEDFGAIPERARTLRVSGGIVTPAPAAGDQTIISARVPAGYDGIIQGYFFAYSGTGFEQGSGDILFRMRINQYYARDLGNLVYAMGSSQFPVPMTQGQIVKSGDQIEMVVNVPNLSGLIEVGASTITAGLYGFFFPR